MLSHRHNSQLSWFPEIKRIDGNKRYLRSLLTCLARARRPRPRILLILKSALFCFGVWLLLAVGLGLAGLIIFDGFGYFCFGLRRLLGRILLL